MAGRTAQRVARTVPPWAAAVLGTWLLGTIVLSVIAQRISGGNLTTTVIDSAAHSFVVCIAVGGPATFAALTLRQAHRAGTALAGGLVAAAVAFAIVFASISAGTAWVSAIAPVALALAAEFSAGLLLLTRPVTPR